MRCGISTACFYPENTLRSLQLLAQSGVRVTEIFLNTFSELEEEYIAKLTDVVNRHHMDVCAVHPFTSAFEGFFFTTDYPGRMEDGLKVYRRYFEVCNALGSNKLVFHGDHKWAEEGFPLERYAHRFELLAEEGRAHGVTVCHENVSYCRLGDPATVKKARGLFGKNAAFVLDTKQVQRFGADIEEMLDAMGGDVRHVHISDFTPAKACIPPGCGAFDFKAFVQNLAKAGYTGDFIIELYRDGFDTVQDLLEAKTFMEKLLEEYSR